MKVWKGNDKSRFISSGELETFKNLKMEKY